MESSIGTMSKDKGSKGKKAAEGEVVLPALELKPTAFNKTEAQGVMIASRQLPGYVTAVNIVAYAMSIRADRILMDFTAQNTVIRSRIDGVWEAMPPIDRPSGDAALFVIKKIWGMNPNDRRSKQEGKCAAAFQGGDWIIDCTSQAVPTGERVLLSINPKKPVLKTLTDLGMRDKMQEQYKALLNDYGKLVIISGPPSHGLPTTWRISLESADKFVRDWVELESKHDHEAEMINVTQNFFDTSANETPEGVLAKVVLKQPDVYVMPSYYNESVLKMVLNQLKTENKHTVTRVVANDPFEAILILLTTYRAQAKEILEYTSGVINQRLVRRLCDKCRESFQPTPQLLQKLGVPPGRIPLLYKPYVPPPPEQRVDEKGNPIEIPICPKCKGRGYCGRVAVFELLTLTKELKSALLKYAKTPDVVRQYARKQGHLSIQDEGILAVATGLTSLQELQRVMQAKPS